MSTLRGCSPQTAYSTSPPRISSGRAVAFGQGAATVDAYTPQGPRSSAGRPAGGAVNRFIFGGMELIPCAAIVLLGGAAAFYGSKFLVVSEWPLKLGYNLGVRRILGHFIPSLRALPHWGWWSLMPDFTKHL